MADGKTDCSALRARLTESEKRRVGGLLIIEQALRRSGVEVPNYATPDDMATAAAVAIQDGRAKNQKLRADLEAAYARREREGLRALRLEISEAYRKGAEDCAALGKVCGVEVEIDEDNGRPRLIFGDPKDRAVLIAGVIVMWEALNEAREFSMRGDSGEPWHGATTALRRSGDARVIAGDEMPTAGPGEAYVEHVEMPSDEAPGEDS